MMPGAPITGILFLAHRIPYPPDRGDKIRSFHLLKALSALAPVHVGAFADDARDMGFADTLSQWTASQKIVQRNPGKIGAAASALVGGLPMSVSLFDDKALHAYVAETLASQPISHIFVFSGQMAHYVPEDFSGRFLMDFVDVDSEKFVGYSKDPAISFAMRQIYAREAKQLSAFEHKTAARADVSLFVSEAEAALFRDRSGLDSGRVRALENGIDLGFYDPALEVPPAAHPVRLQDAPLIVFTGQMDYRPNIEAVSLFAREAMPSIRAKVPTAQFAIVGRNPSTEVEALASLAGTIVTGAVDDVRSWLKAATVVVAPLRLARGIQNKVLEAMAMAKPVVASPAAAEGIAATPGRDLIVADGAQAEAEAVLSLISIPMRANLIGAAARKQMVEHYAWEARLAALPELMHGNTAIADLAGAL